MVNVSPTLTEFSPDAARTLFKALLSLDLEQCDIEVCFAATKKDETRKTRQKKNGTTPAPTDVSQKSEGKEVVLSYAKLKMTRVLADGFLETLATILSPSREKLDTNDYEFLRYGFDGQVQEQQIEYLQIANYPTLDGQLQPLSSLEGIDLFQDEQSFTSGLRFYVILLKPRDGGDPVYLFRSYQRQRFFHQNGGILAMMQDGTYDRISRPVYYFDEEIDFISYNGVMFIFNKAKTRFQNTFHFYESVQKTATEVLQTVHTTLPIHNFEQFATMCQADPQKLRKLNRIATRPYLKDITMEKVKKTIEHHKLTMTITIIEGREHLVYNEKDARSRWIILNLLDDNYLESLMTGRNYLATDKQEV